MDNIETRLKALEYELSQIVDSEYLNELNKYPNKDLQKNLVINIIPSKDISFKTRALLSDILDRLELTRQDRQDLEKYIIYGGGENIEYIKSTIGDLLNKVPELNYLIDNIQTLIPLLNKLDELFKDADENLDSFKELYNTLNLLKTSINNLNTTHNNDIKQINNTINGINNIINIINQTINNDVLLKKDSPFEKGSVDNSAVLKGGNNQVISEDSISLGKNNIAGLKGWYYKRLGIYESGVVTIALTKTQQIPVFSNSSPVGEKHETDIPFDLEEGDVISVINDAKYDNLLVITHNNVSTNGSFYAKPILGNMPFDSIKTDEDLLNGIFDPEDYSIYCLSKPDAGIVDIGQGSIAGGYDNKATNGKTTAFGFNNHAYGKFSFVEGRDNKAGYAAHAEGRGTKANGEESHAEGLNTTAGGKHSHAEGDITEATGINAHAEGYLSKASGNSSHAEGGYWVKGATGDNRVNGGNAEGAGSHAEGARTTAIANYSHAEGYRSIASGPNSHSEGQLTRTGGEDADRPKGNPGTVSGQNAHAEGAVTFAQGAGSHAEGGNTWASGNYSHAEGWQTRTYEDANNSHAEGFYTETTNRAEHAEGEYNKSNTDTIHSVGIGTSNTKRKNAHEIMQDGKHYIYGVGGYDGTNAVIPNAQGIIAKSVQEVINELVNKLNEITTND